MGLSGKRVSFGVGGGIAAYKACQVIRLLVHEGAKVRAVMTPSATRFVTPLTVQGLTGEPVLTDLFDAGQDLRFGHLDVARGADLFVVAPATANLLGRIRAGLGDDPVTTSLLAARCPVLLAPAMNVAMWENEIVQSNVAALKALPRFHMVGPAAGLLADGDTGMGRLAEPEDIVAAARALLAPRDLTGKRLVITAGPTREHLDPVRFISNPSTGRMGFALAAAARDRGAEVVLIAGPTEIAAPSGVRLVRIVSAEELSRAALAEVPGCDVFIAAAAVADERPATRAQQKIKKSSAPTSLALEPTPDALLQVSQAVSGRKPRPVLVGFAAETEKVAENAGEKLRKKGLDLMVANDVSAPSSGFASAQNQVLILSRDGATHPLPLMSKESVAAAILDWVVALLQATTRS